MFKGLNAVIEHKGLTIAHLVILLNTYNAGIDLSRQNLTSVDVSI